jgi:hypothetical protein
VKDENDVHGDFHIILNRRKNYSQLMNVHSVSDVRQNYMQLHGAP